MRTTKIMALLGVLAFGLLAGCQPREEASTNPTNTTADDAAGPTAANVSGLLAGPVPQCPELTSPARRDYRIAAFRVCEQATSLDARLKNPGCLAKQKMSQCMGSEESRHYTLELFKSEEREALH